MCSVNQRNCHECGQHVSDELNRQNKEKKCYQAPTIVFGVLTAMSFALAVYANPKFSHGSYLAQYNARPFYEFSLISLKATAASAVACAIFKQIDMRFS